MNRLFCTTVAAILWLASTLASAAVSIKLDTTVEDKVNQLRATITSSGNPVANAEVHFFLRRTFGDEEIKGETEKNQTDTDGTAVVIFPADQPGDSQGNLWLQAKVTAPAESVSQSEWTMFPGGVPLKPPGDPFPRALWAPNAPRGLMITIGVLLAAVAGSYLAVMWQILLIRKGAKS